MTERDTERPVEPATLDADRQVADAIAAERVEANRLMISGIAIGALDVVAIAALGVGCPLCAVGAPALLGWGAYRRWKVKKFERAAAEEARSAEETRTAEDGAGPTAVMRTSTVTPT